MFEAHMADALLLGYLQEQRPTGSRKRRHVGEEQVRQLALSGRL
jgi:hypothetical protein